MTVSNIRWFMSRSNSIFQVHPNFDEGTNADFKADITHDRVRELKPVGDFPLLNDIVDTYMLHDTLESLITANLASFEENEACFIDVDGVVHLVSSVENNESSAPYAIMCEGDTVLHCGEYLEGEGYAIEEQYTLHTIPELSKILDEVNA